jgi:hypothetical protein
MGGTDLAIILKTEHPQLAIITQTWIRVAFRPWIVRNSLTSNFHAPQMNITTNSSFVRQFSNSDNTEIMRHMVPHGLPHFSSVRKPIGYQELPHVEIKRSPVVNVKARSDLS